MTDRLQGNIAILTGYLVLFAASVDRMLAVALVAALVVGYCAYRLRPHPRFPGILTTRLPARGRDSSGL
jgi:hypothetical protein